MTQADRNIATTPKNLTRRTALTGGAIVAAAVVAQTTMAVAAVPDAELLALGRELEAKNLEVEKALALYTSASDRLYAMTGRQPSDAEWRSAREESGHDEMEAEWEARFEELWEIAREIWAVPAHTPAGMLLKLRAAELVASLPEPGESGSEAWKSIVGDIRAMAVQS
jgi:hypothetical protein